MKTTKHRILDQCLVVLVFSVLLSACGNSSPQEKTGPAVAPQVQDKTVTVVLSPVTVSDEVERFTLPGSLEAWEDLSLSAELDGAVRWVGPKEGDRVRKGEAILKIDTDTLEAATARDRAEKERARSHHERMKQLVEKRLVSRQEYEDALQTLKAAEANLRLSEVELDKGTLRAPVNGVLDRLLVDRGEYVNKGASVAVVVQVDRLNVLVDVPEKDVEFLKVGAEAALTTATINDSAVQTFKGEIAHISFNADQLTRTYRAKISVDNRKGELRPGMIVKAAFVRRNLSGIISVPLYAVQDREGAKVAFVAEGDLARMRRLVTGSVVGERILVHSGLAAAEQLIVKGQHLLTDGARIAVMEQ